MTAIDSRNHYVNLRIVSQKAIFIFHCAYLILSSCLLINKMKFWSYPSLVRIVRLGEPR